MFEMALIIVTGTISTILKVTHILIATYLKNIKRRFEFKLIKGPANVKYIHILAISSDSDISTLFSMIYCIIE